MTFLSAVVASVTYCRYDIPATFQYDMVVREKGRGRKHKQAMRRQQDVLTKVQAKVAGREMHACGSIAAEMADVVDGWFEVVVC